MEIAIVMEGIVAKAMEEIGSSWRPKFRKWKGKVPMRAQLKRVNYILY